MFPKEHLAFIALGSNQGDPAGNVLRAIQELRALSQQPLLVSSLWETAPVDCPPNSATFVNAAVGLHPGPEETPESLLVKLKAIEKKFGRGPKLMVNEPRPLDLDLIVFGRETRSLRFLVLPHPRAHLRRFVLAPLSEIAPKLVLPGHAETVLSLLHRLPSEPAARRALAAAEVRARTQPFA